MKRETANTLEKYIRRYGKIKIKNQKIKSQFLQRLFQCVCRLPFHFRGRVYRVYFVIDYAVIFL